MSLHRLRKSDTVPAVGRDIDAWCTRCKLDLGHVITAMSGDTVVQVRCNTCGSVHRYKDPAAADRAATRRVAQTTGAGARRAATAAAARPNAHRIRYEKLMAERDRSSATRYHPTISLRDGDLLDHARFGYGIVESVDGGKARVMFEDGERTLVVDR